MEEIFEINGIDICVSTFGSIKDPAILLLAGGAASLLFWDEKLCDRLAAAGSFFIIRYDQRDTGRSTTVDPGAGSYTLQDLAADALAILDALGISDRKAHLVGFSLGGGVSQMIAAKNPDRVATLTLISTSPVGAYRDEPDLPPMSDEQRNKFTAIAPRNLRKKDDAVRFLVHHARLCASPSHAFDEAGEIARAERNFERSYNLQSMFVNHGQVAHRRWAREQLVEIKVPTLIIHGDEDPVMPYSHGVALGSEIQGAEVLTLKGIGHELPSNTWDVIVLAIVQHINKTDNS
jgi:pimeloyl-ACP methyl ester carboxylesterase